jgi:succinate dehydrogenase / fumarate reductase cytochrome b subunit
MAAAQQAADNSSLSNHIFTFLKSSIGKKFLMGLTGLVWSGFVFGHMAGNMLIFVSADAFNMYGHAIVSNKPLLYGAELVLSLALLVHVTLALLLVLENKKARPTGYAASPEGAKQASVAASTMKYTGSIILFFIVYHLITFKYGAYYTTTVNGVEMRDLARLMVEVFSQPAYVAGYIISLVLLAMHLKHGFAASFQSIGFRHPRYTPFIKSLSVIYAVVVTAGFISQPIYVFFMARN